MSRGTTLRQAVRDGKVNGIYRIEFNNRPFNIVAITNGVGVGALPLDDLPNKALTILGVRVQFSLTKQDANLTATFAGVWSLGTVPPAVDATLTGTEADIFPSTAFTAVAGAFVANPTPLLVARAAAVWGATDEINLNVVVTPETGIVDGSTAVVRASGFVDLNLAMW